MLAIRMQRTGRKGSAQFRMIVQDSRRTPTSGNIVALLGSYDPHSKVVNINKEKASYYLANGAQPSERVVRILKSEKIAIPTWVQAPVKKTGSIKNQEKLRKNRPEKPAEEVEAKPAAEVVEAEVAEATEPVEEQPAETEESEKAEAETIEESSEESAGEGSEASPVEESTTEETPAEDEKTEA